MEELKQFLKTNEKAILDVIEAKPAKIVVPAIQANLITELTKLMPSSKGLDKAHSELALAIMESMWCGWLSEAKARDGRYSKNVPSMFIKAIKDAFEIGTEYADERP
jgi:hypothetical protein